jgi:hypothetical protein
MTDDDEWELFNAIEALDSWAGREQPSQDLRLIVAEWTFNRHADPFAGMERVEGFPNLWFGEVRGTRDKETAVTCTCRISWGNQTVTFDNFTTLHVRS